MEEQQTTQQPVEMQGCPGDCKKCAVSQQTYCAAQVGLNNMRFLLSLRDTIGALQEKVDSLQARLHDQSVPVELKEAPSPEAEPDPKKKKGK